MRQVYYTYVPTWSIIQKESVHIFHIRYTSCTSTYGTKNVTHTLLKNPINGVCVYSVFRAQGDVYRLQNKFEGAQHEVDRLTMDLEKANILASKHKDDHKKVEDDFHALQEEFDSTRLQFSRTKDSEAKFKDDFERAAMDVAMLRERFEKAQSDLAKVKGDRDRAVGDADKLNYELEKATNQYNKSHNNLEKSQEEVARLQVS